MKKTKIICSIGPSSENYETLVEMSNSGMNVARINFSHGDEKEWKMIADNIKRVNDNNDTNIAILYDTKGPDLRIGAVENNAIKLKEGSIINLTTKRVLGNKDRISLSYDRAVSKIPLGASILIEDGLFKLEVIGKTDDELTCVVINGGTLSSRKSVNIPGIDLGMEFVSKQDMQDIIFACHNDGDFLALSFVNSKADIEVVREILRLQGRSDMQIISKIESSTSIDNIDDIIKASDGVMIARGDLGVEMPLSRLPILQKEIINKCKQIGRTCIVATEMMASMYQNARPSRAEISDIANAVLDGTDAVMLSGETTVGKYPVLATSHMAEACESAEEYYSHGEVDKMNYHDIPRTIASSVISAARLLDVKCIVAATKTGYTAKLISDLRPKAIILATCASNKVARSLALSYGVYPKVVGLFLDFEDVVNTGKQNAIAKLNLQKKDKIIITGGTPIVNREKTTNFMKIEEV